MNEIRAYLFLVGDILDSGNSGVEAFGFLGSGYMLMREETNAHVGHD